MDNRKQSYQFGFYSYIEEKVRNRAMALYREEWRVEAYVRLFNLIAYHTRKQMCMKKCFARLGSKENGWQCVLDRRGFFMADLMAPIPASSFKEVAGKREGSRVPYADALADMKAQGFIHVNHSYEAGVRPMSYSVHKRLMLEAEDATMANKPKWVFVCIPRPVERAFLKKCEDARALGFVECEGVSFRLDVDALLDAIEVETERNLADKSALTFQRAEATLDCFLDKTGNHEDCIRGSRNYHFVARTPSAGRRFYKDRLGRPMRELYDIPCANLLTTALLAADERAIDFNEFDILTRMILDESHPENRGIYGAFCREVGGGMMSRDFAKRAFQTVINATDAQLAKHERIAAHLTGSDEERVAWLDAQNGEVEWLERSSCVEMVERWLSSKVPGFTRWLRSYRLTASPRQTGKLVKATFYGFTEVEKKLVDAFRQLLFEERSLSTIRVHDALWGFGEDEVEEEVERICGRELKKEVEEKERKLLSLYVGPGVLKVG